MADVPVKWKIGTPQTLINSSTDVANNNFSAAGTAFTNNDSNVPMAQEALYMLIAPDFGGTPAAGAAIEVWAVHQNVDSTDDETDAPSGTAQGGAIFLVSIPIAPTDALQRRERRGPLPLRDWVPYLRNLTGQNLNNDGGTNCVLKVTPIAPYVSTP